LVVAKEFYIETDSKSVELGYTKEIKIPMYAHVSKMILYLETSYTNGSSPSYDSEFPFSQIRKITVYGNGSVPIYEIKGTQLRYVSQLMTGKDVEYDSPNTTASASVTYKFRVTLPVFQPATLYSYLIVKIEFETLSNIGSDITFTSGTVKILPIYTSKIPFIIKGHREDKEINSTEDSFTLPINEKPKWILLKVSDYTDSIDTVKFIHKRKEVINASYETLRELTSDLVDITSPSTGVLLFDMKMNDTIDINTQFKVKTTANKTIELLMFNIIGESTDKSAKEETRVNPKLLL